MFAQKLKEARLKSKLTQTQLGQAISKDKIIISKFESGYCLPNEHDLIEICKILKTSPQKLNYPQVATAKIRVATDHKSKPRVNTYKLSVSLNRDDFSKLTKNNLKKCGYKNLREFIEVAYKELEKQLESNNSK